MKSGGAGQTLQNKTRLIITFTVWVSEKYPLPPGIKLYPARKSGRNRRFRKENNEERVSISQITSERPGTWHGQPKGKFHPNTKNRFILTTTAYSDKSGFFWQIRPEILWLRGKMPPALPVNNWRGFSPSPLNCHVQKQIRELSQKQYIAAAFSKISRLRHSNHGNAFRGLYFALLFAIMLYRSDIFNYITARILPFLSNCPNIRLSCCQTALKQDMDSHVRPRQLCGFAIRHHKTPQPYSINRRNRDQLQPLISSFSDSCTEFLTGISACQVLPEGWTGIIWKQQTFCQSQYTMKQHSPLPLQTFFRSNAGKTFLIIRDFFKNVICLDKNQGCC